MGSFVIGKYCRVDSWSYVHSTRIWSRPNVKQRRENKSHPCQSLATRCWTSIAMWSNKTVYYPHVTSLYLTEWQFIVYFLGLFLILTVAALALWTARLFHRTPTAAMGAHRLSSKCQSGYHRRSGRFVIKNPLDFAHYVCV
ncbi:hypothetical protein ALC53_03113 [Atta colombica]|uniref:Uncharacterized protein n=1 Tax=Atta colombica TaxID=520822 RepID=A0A195BRP5_9HYME|nr:hypothetical protein ALC53_03113 [Atta colombica]